LVLTGLVAVAVASVQLIPTLELLRLDALGHFRGGRSTSFLDGVVALPFLISFVVPGLWGSTETFDLAKIAHTSSAMFQGYIGVVPFVLAVIAVVARRDPHTRAFTIAGSAFLIVLFFVPVVRQYLYYRSLAVYAFFAAALAALGMDLLLTRSVEAPPALIRRARWSLRCLGILFLAAALGIVCVQAVFSLNGEKLLEISRTVIRERASDNQFAHEPNWLDQRVHGFWSHYRLTNAVMWVPLLAGLLATGLLSRSLRRSLTRLGGAALIAMTVIDLLFLARQYLPMVDTEKFPLYPPTPILTRLQSSATRVYCLPTTGRFIVPDDILSVYGVASLTGYDSLAPLTMASVLQQSGLQSNAAALGICSVTHVLSNTNEVPTDPAFELVSEQDAVRIYRNTAALPRARFVSHYLNVSNLQECKAIMARPDWQPQTMPLIETDRPPAVPSNSPAEPAQVQIISETTTEVKIAVQTGTDGYVLLADTFYPGWKAYVDNQATTVCRANGAQRAVFVEAGQHRVRFQYAPVSIRLGAWISGVTTLGCLGIWLIRPRRKQ
jgi:hypothetical protein